MSTSTEKKEYDDIRKIGKEALGKVLKQTQNIKIMEKNIHKQTLSKINENVEEEDEDEDEEDDNYEGIYKRICYQVVGDILKGIDLKIILKQVKKGLLCWDYPSYTSIKYRIEEQDDFIINPFEVVEGVTECKKCGSKRVFTYQLQDRASDESSSTINKCVKCKASWKYSG
jgi:DNA-directed RNA polymerase subunit M/transcription elongation factor TFIIS